MLLVAYPIVVVDLFAMQIAKHYSTIVEPIAIVVVAIVAIVAIAIDSTI